jgi:hypothetical protein
MNKISRFALSGIGIIGLLFGLFTFSDDAKLHQNGEIHDPILAKVTDETKLSHDPYYFGIVRSEKLFSKKDTYHFVISDTLLSEKHIVWDKKDKVLRKLRFENNTENVELWVIASFEYREQTFSEKYLLAIIVVSLIITIILLIALKNNKPLKIIIHQNGEIHDPIPSVPVEYDKTKSSGFLGVVKRDPLTNTEQDYFNYLSETKFVKGTKIHWLSDQVIKEIRIKGSSFNVMVLTDVSRR